jgi:hypothetical protein
MLLADSAKVDLRVYDGEPVRARLERRHAFPCAGSLDLDPPVYQPAIGGKPAQYPERRHTRPWVVARTASARSSATISKPIVVRRPGTGGCGIIRGGAGLGRYRSAGSKRQ